MQQGFWDNFLESLSRAYILQQLYKKQRNTSPNPIFSPLYAVLKKEIAWHNSTPYTKYRQRSPRAETPEHHREKATDLLRLQRRLASADGPCENETGC